MEVYGKSDQRLSTRFCSSKIIAFEGGVTGEQWIEVRWIMMLYRHTTNWKELLMCSCGIFVGDEFDDVPFESTNRSNGLAALGRFGNRSSGQRGRTTACI